MVVNKIKKTIRNDKYNNTNLKQNDNLINF